MNESTPRVSVLMPTFKQAHFIQRALESLLAQTMTDWELLIVDDGSPDNTLAVIQPYLADARIAGPHPPSHVRRDRRYECAVRRGVSEPDLRC